ncbi:MAG: sulfatase family protein [Planctomycetota bacterium]|jgi:arylsulfatase A-like enzyme
MPTKEKLNFLIIITDQFNPNCMGYDGHPVVKTPNIDKLAKSGTIFSRAYTNQPLCTPARATMWTGLQPRGHRVRMNGMPLDPAIPTFTEALRQNGYHTHLCGKIHLDTSQPPKGADIDKLDAKKYPECGELWRRRKLTDLEYPFYGLESCDYANGHGNNQYGQHMHWLEDNYPEEFKKFAPEMLEEPTPVYEFFNRKTFKWALSAKYHPTTWIADKTIEFLDKAAGAERPFCLFSSIQDPHSPFAPPKEYVDKYKEEDVPPPIEREGELDDLPPHFRTMVEVGGDSSGNREEPMNITKPYRSECAANYYAIIELIDDQVGRIMESLEDNGLRENTVVMFVADHGEALGDHGVWGKGPYHYDSVIRIPFFISLPEKFKQGQVCDEVVSLVDFAPTILDIAGVPIPEGEVPPVPETENAPPAWPGISLKPILEGAKPEKEMSCIVEMDEDYFGFKMRTMVTKRYRMTCYSGHDYGELFDLENDREELYNLWDKEEHRELRDQLRIKMLDKIMQTDISLPRQRSRA